MAAILYSVSDLNVMGWRTAPASMSMVGVVAKVHLTLEGWEEMVGI